MEQLRVSEQQTSTRLLLGNEKYVHESYSLACNQGCDDVTTTGHQGLMIPFSRLLFVWAKHISASLFTLPLFPNPDSVNFHIVSSLFHIFLFLFYFTFKNILLTFCP